MAVPATVPPVAIETSSADETRALGAALAAVAAPGDRISLLGELGSGKTQLAKGFAVGLGVRDVVNSPSFTLMAEYLGRLPLFHIDLYRLSGSEEVLAGGLLDERQADGVTLTEWAQRLDPTLDPDRLELQLSITGDASRAVEVRTESRHYIRYLDAAARWAAGDRR